MITAQIETMESCLPELLGLWPRHWEELALFKDRIPLRPQVDEYIRRNRIGSLFLATVRWNGRLAGYFICQVAAGFHYGETLTGTTDIYWIDPELRQRGLFLPLYRCVERELRRRGVVAFYSGFKTNLPLDMDKMLPKLGFIPADTYLLKWLGDDRKPSIQGIQSD